MRFPKIHGWLSHQSVAIPQHGKERRISPQSSPLYALSDGVHECHRISQDHDMTARFQLEPPLHICNMRRGYTMHDKSNNRSHGGCSSLTTAHCIPLHMCESWDRFRFLYHLYTHAHISHACCTDPACETKPNERFFECGQQNHCPGQVPSVSG